MESRREENESKVEGVVERGRKKRKKKKIVRVDGRRRNRFQISHPSCIGGLTNQRPVERSLFSPERAVEATSKLGRVTHETTSKAVPMSHAGGGRGFRNHVNMTSIGMQDKYEIDPEEVETNFGAFTDRLASPAFIRPRLMSRIRPSIMSEGATMSAPALA